MRLIVDYTKKYIWMIVLTVALKVVGAGMELSLPYILEHLVDHVAPTENLGLVIVWGCIMLAVAVLTRYVHVYANQNALGVSKRAAYKIRRDLFQKSVNLSGDQMDEFGLPSLTSRMTTDTYNVQDCVRMVLSMGIRAPLLLLGGVAFTMKLDPGLGVILAVITPIALILSVAVSMKGVPLYKKVQQSVDSIVRVMRETITGIRVVKALSKEEHEKSRFAAVNEEMTRRESRTTAIMSLPGPLLTLLLNVGLVLVVIVGAARVNSGVIDSGVILAFLTYFNMILMGVTSLGRIFLTVSKANASAGRIAAVLNKEEAMVPIPEEESACADPGAQIQFDHVSFRYGKEGDESHRLALSDISFSIKKGGSLGIIGPTGCGKTTIINLLMRFYESTSGRVYVDGKDVRTYYKDDLRRKFGVVFQNDIIFADTLADNISFGRGLEMDAMREAARDACAAEFIEGYKDQYQHRAAIHGSNLSGGQRQRVLISRSLAGSPDILILDDASSALDYKTDSALRKAIRERHSETTSIIVAQRVSSIMNLDEILVLDEGRCVGQGTHEELLRTCPQYRDIYNIQMGEVG